MSNFKFLRSDPRLAPIGEIAIAAENPLRPVCALGTSPKGRGKGYAEALGTVRKRWKVGHGTWLPLWGSWHGESRD